MGTQGDMLIRHEYKRIYVVEPSSRLHTLRKQTGKAGSHEAETNKICIACAKNFWVTFQEVQFSVQCITPACPPVNLRVQHLRSIIPCNPTRDDALFIC